MKDIKLSLVGLVIACGAFAFGFDHGRLSQIDRLPVEMQCTLHSLSPMPKIGELK